MINWSVHIETFGRRGTISYREGLNVASLYAERGGSDIEWIIVAGPPQDWDSTHPWALGRRREILERVASAVIQKEAWSYHFEFGDDDTTVLIRRTSNQFNLRNIARVAVTRILHDRWSILVLLILALPELALIRACAAQIAAEKAPHRIVLNLHGFPPSAVSFFVLCAVAMPAAFTLMWFGFAILFEWLRLRRCVTKS